MNKLLQLLVGSCRHKNTTWPFSRINGKKCQPHVCCLDCGKELSYDVLQMRRVA